MRVLTDPTTGNVTNKNAGEGKPIGSKADAEPTPGGGVTETGSLATPISSASAVTVPQWDEDCKKKAPPDLPGGAACT